MSAATLVAAVLCLCLCAQAAPAMVVQLNRDAVVALNENVVIARLNPEAVARITGQTLTGTLNIDAVKPVDTTKPIIARLNPEAVARITGQPLVATLNINAVKPVQAKPVQMEVNMAALKAASAKPVQMELNMAALKAASAKPVQMELNMAALKAATAPVGLEVDLENFGSEALKSVFPGKLSSFSYTDCAKASAPAHVSQFSLTPDPVQIPGNITISLKASLATNQSAPIKASIKLQKKSKIGTWNTIPCIDNVGSCTYDDLCAVLEKNIPLVDGQCPPEFIEHNAPCRCPIPSGQISVAGLSVAIPKLPPSIPSFLLSGDFQVNVQLFDNTNTQMFCLNVFVTLSDN